MRLAAATASSQPPAILPHFVPFISQYHREYTTWKPHNHSKAILIPLGVGFGKVFKVHNVIVNASIEPQVTVYHNGTGLPAFQLFTGLYFLFPKKN
jgi:hypothetical protein